MTFGFLGIPGNAIVLIIYQRRSDLCFHLLLPQAISLASCFRLRLPSSFDFSAPEHMREKRLVTFRMAPNKSKRQGSEKEATIADGWRKSKLSESAISSLVGRRLLRPRSVVQWFSAEGHDRPYERVAKTVMFKSFVEHGLGIPVCDFL